MPPPTLRAGCEEAAARLPRGDLGLGDLGLGDLGLGALGLGASRSFVSGSPTRRDHVTMLALQYGSRVTNKRRSEEPQHQAQTLGQGSAGPTSL